MRPAHASVKVTLTYLIASVTSTGVMLLAGTPLGENAWLSVPFLCFPGVNQLLRKGLLIMQKFQMKKMVPFSMAVVLIAMNLRMAIISVPPLTAKLLGAGISSTAIGLLTTIPLLCFGGFSALIGVFVPRIGASRLVAISLAVLAVANGIRVLNQPLLLIGTVFVGLSITALNVLLPVIILENRPQETGRLNGLYTSTFNVCAAVASMLVVPAATLWGWQVTMQWLSVPAVLGLVSWWLTPKQSAASRLVRQPEAAFDWQLLRQPTVWLLALFFGGQSLVFYTISAWLPSILTTHQLTPIAAGISQGLFQLIGVPAAYLLPQLRQDRHSLLRVMIVLLLGYVLGIGGLLVGDQSVVLLELATIILGITTTAIFSLALSLVTLVAKTAVNAGIIGGIVQSIGYLLASVGPSLLGQLKTRTQSWNIVLLILMLLSAAVILIGLGLTRRLPTQHPAN